MLTVANSPAREEQAEVYRMVDNYVGTFPRMFTDGERIKSLYLFSESPGTGKTTTACAIANEYLTVHYVGSRQRGLRPLERPIYFLDVNEWQTLFNRITLSVGEESRKAVSDAFQRRMDIAVTVPFLIMDDLGVRSISEAFRSYVHAIINARVNSAKPMIYTSNIPLQELKDVFEDRLYDRIRDLTVTLDFKGESKRGLRR